MCSQTVPCGVLRDLCWVLDEVTVVVERGPRMEAGVWCRFRGLSDRQVLGAQVGNSELLELRLRSARCTLRRTCRAMTLWSPRGLGAPRGPHFPFYYSYPYFFQPCLNWPEKWPLHSRISKKREFILSTAALGTPSGFIAKEALACLYCTPHPSV